jgi:hypothetical protein
VVDIDIRQSLRNVIIIDIIISKTRAELELEQVNERV